MLEDSEVWRDPLHSSVARRSNFPNRNANVGSTSRFNAADVINPPRITVAIGPSISLPGSPPPSASGSRPSAVTSALIAIGAKRSLAPRSAVSKFHAQPAATLDFSPQCELVIPDGNQADFFESTLRAARGSSMLRKNPAGYR